MHFIFSICQWLEQTPVGTSIRESLWLFPIIETVHIFGIILLVGATSILDLRLMGLTFRDERVSKLAQRFLPWAWAGFIIQVITGLLLFSSEATKMYGNIGFDIKMLLIAVAGINALRFPRNLLPKCGEVGQRSGSAPGGAGRWINFHLIVVRHRGRGPLDRLRVTPQDWNFGSEPGVIDTVARGQHCGPIVWDTSVCGGVP